tara:strand:- start:3063 stop:5036 length:1974 start_codon:yes stop_codon:yes gene_type:complete
MENETNDNIYSGQKLEQWVIDKCDGWRDNYNNNYRTSHDEYYRLWRGIWAKEDSMRDTERSRIITPALQQAVESSVAEVEEATFGRGRWFDIRDDVQDQNGSADIEFTRKQLDEDMQFGKARSSISECLLNAAVFGTGIGEVYLEETKEHIPHTQQTPEGMQAGGVLERNRFLVKLRPIMPQNFLIDPLATSIEEALGCAVDMYVPKHQVEMDIEKGIYRDVEVGTVESDSELEPDQEMTYETDDRVRLTKYYGLVPRTLFEDAEDEDLQEDEIAVALNPYGSKEDTDSSYVEAIVIIANETTLLKVVANPYMMEDRPIVAFKWDNVPSRFWGRGICEKGYNSQKALDTELRARIDALALTVHPMMAVDASRMPRGSQLSIAPGKTLLTNGNPSEILQPFKFGAVDNITFSQGTQLQTMVQQATGAVDNTSPMSPDGTAAGMSMSLGAIIKRHKRTLLNFQDTFLIPFVEKAMHRYMQFDPELYKAQDHKFVASSSLGIIAREYEVTQLVQLLQTMPAESPMYSILVESIVESMNLSRREEIISTIKQANQPPSPQEQQAAMQEQQLRKQFELEMAKVTLEKVKLEAAEIQSRVMQNQVETQLLPVAEETDRIAAIAKTLPADEFQQALAMAELSLKQQELDTKENIVKLQMGNKNG